MLRSTVEGVTHRIVLPRRLPAEFGRVRMLVSTEGGLRYLFGRMEDVDPLLLGLVSRCVQPGDHVWDVGANLGLFTFAAGAKAGPDGSVVAIEPDSFLVNLLRRSAGRLPATSAPVQVVSAAVSDREGVSRLHIGRRSRSTNYLEGHGTTQTGGVRSSHLVPTVTLDALLDHVPAPSLVKIDVEGAEHLALAGGRRLLGDLAPLLLVEVDAVNAQAVSNVLHGAGYTLFDAEAAPLFGGPVEVAAYSTVAVPPGWRSASD